MRIRFERRLRVAAGVAQQAFDDTARLGVGREQAQRHLRHFRPRHLVAVAERRVGRSEQAIALAIKRHAGDAADRLVVEIGDAGIDLEIFQETENLLRDLRRQNGELHRRDGARDRARSAVSIMASAMGIAAMRSRPVRPCLSAWTSSRMARLSPTMRRAQSSTRSPSGREILEPRAAIDQEHAETLLELLDAGRQRRLGHAAGFGGPAEMLFARQREQEFELIDHNLPTTLDTVTRRARFAKFGNIRPKCLS